MKEHLRQLAARAENDLVRACLAREYLQSRILESLQDDGAFLRWTFLGGTALRFLFGIPRFSEDLVFSLLRPGADAGFREALNEVKRALTLEGYGVEIKVSDTRTVASAWVRFPGLPHELGLSGQKSQTLSIEVVLDTKPPDGAVIETSVVRRHVTLHLCHHDRSSLLAGKLHAILCRPWVKGRDLYDLVWYLSDRDWPAPNLEFLNAALSQTGWKGPALTSKNWRREIAQRLKAMNWEAARADVRPFLERPRDIDLVAPEVLGKLLKTDIGREGKRG